MKATPTFRADLDEYPELGTLVQAAVRHVITIMQVHDIGALRRYRKDGVFERPYAKDTVTPLGVPGVPQTVAASRDAAGSALLDYLEAVGIEGLALEATQEEIISVGQLWNPNLSAQVGVGAAEAQYPKPVAAKPKVKSKSHRSAEKAAKPTSGNEQPAAKPAERKETGNGGHA